MTDSAIDPIQQERDKPAMLMLYAAVFASVGLLLYLGAFLLVRLPAYARVSHSPFVRMLDYGFQQQHTDADVVIFGDSSPLVDIDPSTISASLGLRVVNLPNNLGVLHVTDDMVLRRYLQTNRPPRLLIFYFAPWALDYRQDPLPKGPTADGVEVLMRHGSPDTIAHYASAHPSYVATFPFTFYQVNLESLRTSRNFLETQQHAIIASNGHNPLVPSARLPNDCQIPEASVQASKAETALSLLQRYQAPGMQRMVYLAPVPACRNAALLQQRSYAALGAEPPKQMGTQLFADDGFYIHLNRDGVPQATADLTSAIKGRLAQHP